MIDYKIRQNSKLLIVVSEKESKNPFLMRSLKLFLEQNGYNLTTISFGFYKVATVADLHIAPVNDILAFMDCANKHDTQQIGDKRIRTFPNLSTFALSIELQKQLL